ncbi:DNA-binding protein RFX2-like isoform X4 [Dreissena polymorpha]|uniref:DNA-binding protein RFX2-like isoform X4 n=1 Tax=Dreissena polymorpha TaxID=45954 RepID=UPI00226493FE|nr:DNA-binding protein RFX2-like isoform X4 [Dreissena polymorpha]
MDSMFDSDEDLPDLELMATQTYVTDLQAMNPTVVQVHQVTQNSKTPSSSQSSQATKTATIIQPASAHSGQQQFIVTTSVAEALAEQSQNQENILNQGGQLYPAHVQYVEGNDPSIYASTNGQIQYTGDYGQTAVYNPSNNTYYQTSSGQVGLHVTNMGTVMQGHILTQQGNTYLIQGGTMDGEGAPFTHTTRASPATDELYNRSQEQSALARYASSLEGKGSSVNLDVPSLKSGVQWLIDNYETADGVSLPRSTLYNHYLRHCQEQNLDPMNPASFGKLIRSVFLGLRTRRLGTRGNSKYHYYGIRIKANSPLNQFTDDQTMPMRQQPLYQGKKFRPKSEYGDGGYGGVDGQSEHQPTTQQHQHQQFLGDASTAIPNFGDMEITSLPLPDGIHMDHLNVFQKMYREHAEAVVDVVVNLQFSLIEALWQGFWRNTSLDSGPDNDYEKRLPKDKLYLLCKYEPVQNYVRKSDYMFYQALVEVLIPDVLRPIPSSLTQAIRNFAKSLENWLKGAMANVPEEMVKTKLGAVSAFAQTLRRYTSLNHLAQAARAVLQNTSQINQMLTDLNRVDFANVQEQASWVCQCEDSTVQQLEQDFKKTLQAQNSLEQWAVWLEGVVNQVLKQHEGSPNFPKAARQFLLKWSFYSSMVIRDLTLRSAASFGSFHLIRLLYDEYMFYLVEHKVASATGETPIAVMGEVCFVDLSSAVAMSFSEAEVEKPHLPMHTKPVGGAMIKGPPALIQAPLSKAMAGATSLITRSTADGHGGNSGPTLMVLTTSSMATANQNGALNIASSGSHLKMATSGGMGGATSHTRTAMDGHGGNSGPTLMVLTTSSMATANQNGAMNIASSGAHGGTLTVKTASSGGGLAGAKTIVVMPVSNNYATGDGATAKRFKIE